MIITIDEGTTSTRALMISSSGEILAIVQKEINQIYPQVGWVEHDPLEIWNKTLSCCRELINKLLSEGSIQKSDIKGIAITNQRETSIIWDPRTGKPVYNAIVWQCKRTDTYCKELSKIEIAAKVNFKDYTRAKTGLILDSYFSATKIHWLLENIVKPQNLELDKLCFGTIDTWLIWNLTLGREHLTDATNASRTMLYNIHEDKWDNNILKQLDIPTSLLPRVIESNGDFGSSPLFKDLVDRELPIKAVLGDQQAALYAYNNEAKITYGTGTFILVPNKTINYITNEAGTLSNEIQSSIKKIQNEDRENISINLPTTPQGLLESIAFKTNQTKAYTLEASIFTGGAIVQWLRDGLKLIKQSSEIEKLAANDNAGVYLIPALTGLGAPYWRGDVQGAIFGITRGTDSTHIARAALESIAYQVKDAISDQNLSMINVDGGASKNNTLMQFQADLLQVAIKRHSESEMTALGVARMTGDVELTLTVEKVFEPKGNLDAKYQEWQRYVNKLL